MPNTEWWKQIVIHPYTDNETTKIAAEYLNGLLERVMPRILAHHRKMIVKEIRDEIEKEEQKQPRTGTEAMFQDTYNEAITRVLSLHCLKENEWYDMQRMCLDKRIWENEFLWPSALWLWV